MQHQLRAQESQIDQRQAEGTRVGAIEPRYRALVLLTTFGNLRWGELPGLRRRNLDLDSRCVRVTETVHEFGQLVKGTPKSRASIRTVVLVYGT